jgi:dihydrofolate reductase
VPPSRIRLIAAHDLNRGIGRDGYLPWHIPGELRWTAAVTAARAAAPILDLTPLRGGAVTDV